VEVFDPASTRDSTSPSQSQSYITTDGQPASLSWNKAPIWGLRPDLDYCLTVACLLVWGALSDERRGLSFAIAAGLCQRSLSRVRVPWDSRPYFSDSALRLPFSSPPTTRRVTVEVFDPASTRGTSPSSSLVTSCSYRTDRVENTDSQLLHFCVLRIYCGHNLATAVVYRAIT
jgi:hypothetical protein